MNSGLDEKEKKSVDSKKDFTGAELVVQEASWTRSGVRQLVSVLKISEG